MAVNIVTCSAIIPASAFHQSVNLPAVFSCSNNKNTNGPTDRNSDIFNKIIKYKANASKTLIIKKTKQTSSNITDIQPVQDENKIAKIFSKVGTLIQNFNILSTGPNATSVKPVGLGSENVGEPNALTTYAESPSAKLNAV